MEGHYKMMDGVCLFICLFICPSVCLSLSQSDVCSVPRPNSRTERPRDIIKLRAVSVRVPLSSALT